MAEKEPVHPLSVSSFTESIKSLIEQGFPRVYIEGEISGWKRYPSGHCYFTLKDNAAQVQAVMFDSNFGRCKARAGLKDGAKVLVYARVTVYPARGNYQLIVLDARLAGVGELMQRYLELKQRLEAQGLFDSSSKRELPFLPRRIGIVTSEAGGVIHDMCTVMTRRCPALEIRLYPCLVQGADAPPTVIAGIEYFNAVVTAGEWSTDLIIVARGGGSYEDLFCFNDETLVRAVASSQVPVISAVGHETDFTLCDFAADCRAGTPSIAAEIAVPELAELQRRLELARQKSALSLRSRSEMLAQRLDHFVQVLSMSLERMHNRAVRHLAALLPRMEPALRLRLQTLASRLTTAEAKLNAYSPYDILERGYSLTTAADGSVIKDASRLCAGDEMVTRFAVGEVRSVVS